MQHSYSFVQRFALCCSSVHALLVWLQISASEKFSKIVEVLRTKTKSEQVVRPEEVKLLTCCLFLVHQYHFLSFQERVYY